MSNDYFSALLRSAGHAPRGAPSAPRRERFAADSALGSDSASGDGGDLALESVRNAAGQDASAHASIRGDDGAASHASPTSAGWPQQSSAPSSTSPSSDAHEAAARTREGVERSPPAAHAALKAALAWVGANSPDVPAQSEAAHSRQATLRLRETADHFAPSPGNDAEREIDSVDHSMGEDRPAPREELGDAAARLSRARAAVDAHRPSEVVEVTIGELHLRVDAPPQSTVTQRPAATPPRDSPPRSSLSRRALYRI